MESKTPSKTPIVDSLGLKKSVMYRIDEKGVFEVVSVLDLEDVLEKLPKVYGSKTANAAWTEEPGLTDTHEARLLGVREIVREPCKHDLVSTEFEYNRGCIRHYCISCKAKLRPKSWEEIKETK